MLNIILLLTLLFTIVLFLAIKYFVGLGEERQKAKDLQDDVEALDEARKIHNRVSRDPSYLKRVRSYFKR